MRSSQNSTIKFENGEPLCYHGQPANLFTSHTPANPERPFYSCPMPRGHPENCGFWFWKDHLFPAQGGIGSLPGNTSPSPSALPSRKRDVDTREDVNTSLTPSQKRQRIIEQELLNMTPSSSSNRTNTSNGLKRSASSEMEQRQAFGGAVAASQPPSTPAKRPERISYGGGRSSNVQSGAAALTHIGASHPVPGSPDDPFTQFDDDDGYNMLHPLSSRASSSSQRTLSQSMALGGSRTLGSPPSLPSPPSSSKHPRASNAVDKMYPGSAETLGEHANISSVARKLDFGVLPSSSQGDSTADEIDGMIKFNLDQADYNDQMAKAHRENAKRLQGLKAHLEKLERKRKAAEQRAKWQDDYISKLRQENEELREK